MSDVIEGEAQTQVTCCRVPGHLRGSCCYMGRPITRFTSIKNVGEPPASYDGASGNQTQTSNPSCRPVAGENIFILAFTPCTMVLAIAKPSPEPLISL